MSLLTFFGQTHLRSANFAIEEQFPVNPTKLLKQIVALTLKDSITFCQCPPQSDNEFNALLKTNYNQPAQGKVFDMVTGQHLLHSTVTSAHIFPKTICDKLPDCSQSGIKDINDIHNGLLLFKLVEVAFDYGQICIEVDKVGRMWFTLLDQSIRNKKLIDMACELHKGNNHGNGYAQGEEHILTMFGDLHGQEVHIPEGLKKRPSTSGKSKKILQNLGCLFSA
jgi:HNH endonuclease